MSRILCLAFPHWPVQRCRAAAPELHSATVVIHRRDPRRGELVVDCSEVAGSEAAGSKVAGSESAGSESAGSKAAGSKAAAWSGIRPGMDLAEVHTLGSVGATGRAKSQVHGGPKRVFLRSDPVADRAGLEALAQWCHQFSPIVGLEDSQAPAALLLDVTRTACRLGGEQELSLQILDGLRAQRYVVKGALAGTVGAAWGAAQGADPHTIQIFSPEEWSKIQNGIPVARLRLRAETVELLRQLGIEHLGELLQLPRDGLRLRLGPELLRRIDQFQGTIAEPIQGYQPPPPLEVRHLLEHPTEHLEVLHHVLHLLVHRLADLLQAQGLGTLRLECVFQMPQATEQVLEVNLFRPTAQPDYLERLLRTRLECHEKGFSREVQGILLRAPLNVPLGDQQPQRLFSLQDDEDYDDEEVASSEVAQLVERLSCRLGKEAVVGARLLADPAPEHAFRYQELTGQQPEPVRSDPRTEEKGMTRIRPLVLLCPPLPTEMMRDLSQGGPQQGPVRVQWSERLEEHAVLRTFQGCQWIGPERIQTGWWRGKSIARDYYRIEDDQGCQLWLFRDLTQGTWFVHGIYL